jgi:hypothetical protein
MFVPYLTALVSLIVADYFNGSIKSPANVAVQKIRKLIVQGTQYCANIIEAAQKTITALLNCREAVPVISLRHNK